MLMQPRHWEVIEEDDDDGYSSFDGEDPPPLPSVATLAPPLQPPPPEASIGDVDDFDPNDEFLDFTQHRPGKVR